jgi:hypothetical protein
MLLLHGHCWSSNRLRNHDLLDSGCMCPQCSRGWDASPSFIGVASIARRHSSIMSYAISTCSLWLRIKKRFLPVDGFAWGSKCTHMARNVSTIWVGRFTSARLSSIWPYLPPPPTHTPTPPNVGFDDDVGVHSVLPRRRESLEGVLLGRADRGLGSPRPWP